MIFEDYQRITPFFEWLPPSLGIFFAVLLMLIVLGMFLGFLMCAVRYGPTEGFLVLFKTVFQSVPDIFLMSPRRLYAMSKLAVQESIRRYVLIVFGVFVVVMLFASWFLDVDSEHPALLYLVTVLNFSTILVMILALFLSIFSLPADIQNKTISTVVTKPVRASEIVLGRILGFGFVGTVMLASMALISYIFVVRGLDHGHTFDVTELKASPEHGKGVQVARTSTNAFHYHEVVVHPDGTAYTEPAKGHTHPVTVIGEGDDRKITIGPPRGMLQARVPHWGKLRFLDRNGDPKKQGINVGEEWGYRSYIEGQSLAAAIWNFKHITKDRFARTPTVEEKAAQEVPPEQRTESENQLARSADAKEGLPLELTISVFRTHKGDIVTRVLGRIEICRVERSSPDQPPTVTARSEPITFESAEFTTQQIIIPGKLDWKNPQTGKKEKVDLYDKFVNNGELEIWVYCDDPNQYFGMSEYDLYIRAADGSFTWNFVKGFLSIWMQMIIVICFGVMFSTLIKSPVALLATKAVLILGAQIKFITDLAQHVLLNQETAWGGGPIEATIRILTQTNISIDMDFYGITFVQYIDKAIMAVMWLSTFMLPNFAQFNTSSFVARGYNITGDIIAQQMLMGVAFAITLTVIGYFFLKVRELAA